MARRWMDPWIAGKLFGGLAMIGVSTVIYFNGYIWFWGWAIGGVLFLWGLGTIGDKKNEWENPD